MKRKENFFQDLERAYLEVEYLFLKEHWMHVDTLRHTLFRLKFQKKERINYKYIFVFFFNYFLYKVK